MAKIGTLQVGTVKFEDNALTATSQSAINRSGLFNGIANTVTVPNTAGNPVILIWSCAVTMAPSYGGQTSRTTLFRMSIERTSPSAVTYYDSGARSVTSPDNYIDTWGGSFLDTSPGSGSPSYIVRMNNQPDTGTCTMIGTFMVQYIKK